MIAEFQNEGPARTGTAFRKQFVTDFARLDILKGFHNLGGVK